MKLPRALHRDPIMIATALLGLVLMILTIAFRINPVEGSVVPEYLTGNPLGRCVVMLLFVTSMPAWIAGLFLAEIIPGVNPANPSGMAVAACLMCAVQVVLYAILGKGLSLAVTFARGRKP